MERINFDNALDVALDDYSSKEFISLKNEASKLYDNDYVSLLEYCLVQTLDGVSPEDLIKISGLNKEEAEFLKKVSNLVYKLME